MLRYLEQVGEATTLDALARHIAAKENGIDERALSSSQRKRVYIGLYQAHLPKMDDTGVIEFEKHRGRVELLPAAEPALEYLHLIDAAPSPPRSYLVAALGVGLLAGLGTAGFVPVRGLPFLAVLAVVTTAIHAAHGDVAGTGKLTNPDSASRGADSTVRQRSGPH